jgi:hypothetical protein
MEVVMACFSWWMELRPTAASSGPICAACFPRLTALADDAAYILRGLSVADGLGEAGKGFSHVPDQIRRGDMAGRRCDAKVSEMVGLDNSK